MTARRLLVLSFVLTAVGAQGDTVLPETPSLDRTTVPARGRQTATLLVPAFGRYTIRVESKQGTALQLVDRMAGPGSASGKAGETDGRLDLLLDRGEYQVVTYGDRRASGSAKLEVRAFAELHTPRAPLLIELKPVDAELRDLEQASFWVDIQQPRIVWIEAAGRSLADLRLWRDGTWLVDAEPAREIEQPVVGQPLLVCRLVTKLEPGLYLLTAYGGVPRPWAVEDGRQPFHLRFGIPSLGTAGRQRMTVSAFGRDRFLVPRRTSFFRLELPEARPAALEVAELSALNPFGPGQRRAEVAKTSRPPAAELILESADDATGQRVVTVSAAVGQPYVLQHFELRNEYPFEGSGPYWVSTVHAGAAVDSIDATGILVRSRLPGETWPWEPFAKQTIRLDARTGWARRANLLDEATLFVSVFETGTYEVAVEGIRAEVRVEPFLLWRPDGYEAPPWQPSPSRWELEAGYYVVTLRPQQKGIARITMRPRGLLDRALEVVGLGSEQPLQEPRPAVSFPELALDAGRRYVLYLNRQPEVHAGAVIRQRPVDLGDALPIAQTPGDPVTVPFTTAEPGTVRAEADDGQMLEISVDGGSWERQRSIAPGTHTAVVRLPGKQTVVYSLRVEPQRLASTTPLPALPDARLASLPRFDLLTAAKAQRFDLPAGGQRTFLVRAERPSLYRVQSTGLLATSGTFRSRAVTSLASAAQNGVGRNFTLGQYLREGDYQVTVGVQGESAGHLGLELVETRIANGGDLRTRVPARTTLAAGDAIAYRFTITRPGRFRVRSLGLERTFRCRLEDEHGWPLLTPNGQADVTWNFEPGRYRFTVLPEATQARVVTLIEPVATTRLRRGHGPHRLALAQRIEHVWMEPTSGERVPDTWELQVPAAARVRIELDGGMQGRVVPIEPGGAAIEVPVARGYEGLVAAGAYRLEVVSARPNNRATYRLAVWPEPLLAGMDRLVATPADVPVSIGTAGLYELATFGASDVRGRLYDGEGRLLARSDDRPDDWNLQIAETLASGSYRLRLEPVGRAAASTTVSLRRREEQEETPVAVPGEIDLHPGNTAHLYPLTFADGVELTSAVARSAESVGIALEVKEHGSWRSLGAATGRQARIAFALASGSELRLRVWSLDRRDAPAHLSLLAFTPPRASEIEAGAGVPLAAAAAGAMGIAVGRPGSFRVGGAELWCSAPLVPCTEAASSIVSAAGPLLFALGKPGSSVTATRIALDATRVPLGIAPSSTISVDVAPGDGPVLVRATSQGGQPGLAVEGAGKVSRSDAMAVGTRAAIAVSLESAAVSALLWGATPGQGEIGVDVEAHRFRWTDAQQAEDHLEGPLEPGAARALKLPRGWKRLRLALSAGAVGALSADGRVQSVHWAETGAVTETVETDADRLTLLPPREGPGRYSLEVFGLEDADRTRALGERGWYELQPGRAGLVRLALAPATERARIAIRGASAESVLVTADGEVLRGSDFEAPRAGGTLLLPHGTGLLVAMRGSPRAGSADVRPTEVKPPTSVALHGPVQRLRVETRAPALVHLRAPGAAVTSVEREGEPAVLELHREAVRLDAYLPDGRAEIAIRAVAGGTLHGPAELTAVAVVPIAEGLGPEVLLGPGETRLFSFTARHSGTIGLAVRADADSVETALLSSTGQVLGRGAMQMPTLEAGRYLVSITAPPEAAPVRARAVVVGLIPPDTGPPPEVVRQYATTADEAAAGSSFTARHVETETVIEESVEGDSGEPPTEEETDSTEQEEPSQESEEVAPPQGGLS